MINLISLLVGLLAAPQISSAPGSNSDAAYAAAAAGVANAAYAVAGPSSNKKLAHEVADAKYLYRVTLVRAAPGHYRDVIDLYRAHMGVYEAMGDRRPFWMRHSQGDHWDFMLIFPLESYASYYAPDRIRKRHEFTTEQEAFDEQFRQIAAWTEDLYVRGPNLDVVAERFDGAGYFHVEMFKALPGKHAELIAQRKMENDFYAELGHPGNLIFIRDQGASTDVFTVGFYRDLGHFAENAEWSFEEEDAAARAVGFDGVGNIGPYLRSLIARHHDTLAVSLD